MIQGSGAVPLTNGSGFRWPKNITQHSLNSYQKFHINSGTICPPGYMSFAFFYLVKNMSFAFFYLVKKHKSKVLWKSIKFLRLLLVAVFRIKNFLYDTAPGLAPHPNSEASQTKNFEEKIQHLFTVTKTDY
jgi:hypothetical protein